jgi:hypothetical protein
VSYRGNLLSMTTRWLNSLFGGNRRGESTSAAVGRKAAEGRRLFIAFEALIDVPFALIGQRHHCDRQFLKERG